MGSQDKTTSCNKPFPQQLQSQLLFFYVGVPLGPTHSFSLYSGNLLVGVGHLYIFNPGLCGQRRFVCGVLVNEFKLWRNELRVVFPIVLPWQQQGDNLEFTGPNLCCWLI